VDDSAESKSGKDISDSLTTFWNEVGSSTSTPTYNKKLQVKLVVESLSGSAEASSVKSDAARTAPSLSDKTKVETMTPEQMFSEITSLRRKYDELVSFSVNLTAERDILNNTLEQTKRDLNREMAARAALENGSGRQTLNRGKKDGSKSGYSLKSVLVIALSTYLFGVRSANYQSVPFLSSVPVLKSFFGFDAVKNVATAPSSAKKPKRKSSEL
jgi:type II secretory pathway component GspD/PulD (secretin)